MSNLISVVSTPSLEKWDWRNPEKGIGGSETSHVRMAQILHQRGYDVRSYSPIGDDLDTWGHKDPTGLEWWHTRDHRPGDDKILINYRDPKVLDAAKPEGAKWWFVAQDVDYGEMLTEERRAKIDRYITLCPTHAAYTRGRYPELHRSGRLYVSSNGIESRKIGAVTQGVTRNPKRLMYASSPDRGLLLILENWFRIRERVPDAELHVFYGFHNMEVIIALNGKGDWRYEYQLQLQALLQQPGVVWHDRVGQSELWKEWAASAIWFYPTEFPETSCITSMEAQACGAIPVTTEFWALKSNVMDGYKFDGLPQKSDVVRGLMIDKVVWLLNNGTDHWDDTDDSSDISRRHVMQIEARKRFNWDRIADQWEGWIREDLGLPKLDIEGWSKTPEIEDCEFKPKSWAAASCAVPLPPAEFYGTAMLPAAEKEYNKWVADGKPEELR